MRSRFTVLLGAMLLLGGGAASEEPRPSDPADRASYSLGHQIGRDLKREGSEIDPQAMRRGLLDALAGAEPAIDAREMQRVLSELKSRVLAAERGEQRHAAGQNRKRGEKFLAENAKQSGVVTLSSGLQYKVLQRGSGKKPGADDKVVVHYRGTTLDDHEFHDSRKRPGEAETLHVSGVIRGLTEALQLMKVGAKWQLFLPPALAYGRRGPLANHTVIFEVELISIEPGP